MQKIVHSIILFLLLSVPNCASFSPQFKTNARSLWGTSKHETSQHLFAFPSSAAVSEVTIERDQSVSQAVRAPLKFIGPYPCLALRFSDLSTPSQRQRNVTGVALDFVLDTAANTNTIQQLVAKELNLHTVGRALPGVGAAGMIRDGGETYLLGDAQLDGLQYEEDEVPFTFMSNLSASALPIASPAAAGLLSLAFFQSFPGGVEMAWGGSDQPASVTFYGDKSMDETILGKRTKVLVDRIPITQLPTITISINGVDMPALLDTGSPITVLNSQAAKVAGIDMAIPDKELPNNPFSNIANRFQYAQAATKGDVLMIMGAQGKPVSLIKSKEKASFAITGESTQPIDFGSAHVFVGELPGLAAMNGIGVKAPPAVVLGMDVLRQRPSMLLRLRDDEVWFE